MLTNHEMLIQECREAVMEYRDHIKIPTKELVQNLKAVLREFNCDRVGQLSEKQCIGFLSRICELTSTYFPSYKIEI